MCLWTNDYWQLVCVFLCFFLPLCLQCDGDGRLIPFVYERAVRSQYEDYVFTAIDDYYQDGPPYIWETIK